MNYMNSYFWYAVDAWGDEALRLIVILLVFLILLKILTKVIISAAENLSIDEHIVSLLVRVMNITLFIFALVTVLGTIGINVSALVASLGLTGFAMGYAMKDTISNLISGILILLYRPFVIGDLIGILSYEGVVVDIDLRYTEIESEGNKVLIPNAKLFSDPITVLQSSESETT